MSRRDGDASGLFAPWAGKVPAADLEAVRALVAQSLGADDLAERASRCLEPVVETGRNASVEARQVLKSIVKRARLTAQESTVVSRYFCNEDSLEEIGQSLARSCERVRQIRERALRKLRLAAGHTRVRWFTGSRIIRGVAARPRHAQPDEGPGCGPVPVAIVHYIPREELNALAKQHRFRFKIAGHYSACGGVSAEDLFSSNAYFVTCDGCALMLRSGVN